ncbi:MAG TPA: hypothetical protein VNV36_06255 [Pseudomonas sp.]|uniref:hypothetical protein n=1 Tax=Pseudomonas sp. TaxID=306 RepID=UPI002D189687|nr:hypothetical protein [Pseudomonas sp.]HWH86358.1 hypothetical protein [Pseudomonas sp.]
MLTIEGTFKHGMSIAGVVYTKFKMREADMVDVFAVERETGCAPDSLEFEGALAMRQLVSVSNDERTFTGPFELVMLKKKGDFLALRKAQAELDKLGNEPPTGTETTGTPSSSSQ